MKLRQRFLPFLDWIGELKSKDTLRADMVAGLTVALVLIPQSMAYAQLAGLPAYYGLYISFLPVMVAAIWGSSRQLATGPVAVVSLMTATALAPIVGGTALSSEELAAVYIPLAMLLALLVGIFQFLLGVFRLGVVVNFLSHPVIIGFTNAAAIVIALSQLSKLLGVSMPGAAQDHFFSVRVWGVFEQIGATHTPTLVMGLSSFIFMWLIKRKFPRCPGILMVVVLTTVVSYLIGFEKMGGMVVGVVPAGLPSLQAPNLDVGMMLDLLPAAMVIALVGFMEAISVAKAMAAKTKDHLEPNQELIGQGLANIVGSFTQSYPASGSFSRSAVNLNAGAKTGFSSVVTAIVVMLTLLFLTPLLYHLPQAVLAAVIMMAVYGLLNFKAVKHSWQVNKHDGIASVVTFVATLGFAPHLDKGIIIGAALSIGMYLFRTMKPRISFLGRYSDGTLRDLRIHTDLPVDEKVVAMRFDGSLYFANVSHFEEAILQAVAENPRVEYILVVADGINQLDAAGEDVLQHLISRLNQNNVTLVFSGLKRQILNIMRHTDLMEHIGDQNTHATADLALQSIYERMESNDGEPLYCPLFPGFTKHTQPIEARVADAIVEKTPLAKENP
jgi:SulP family sulfate permease